MWSYIFYTSVCSKRNWRATLFPEKIFTISTKVDTRTACTTPMNFCCIPVYDSDSFLNEKRSNARPFHTMSMSTSVAISVVRTREWIRSTSHRTEPNRFIFKVFRGKKDKCVYSCPSSFQNGWRDRHEQLCPRYLPETCFR